MVGVGDAAFDSPPLTLVGGTLGVDSLSGSGVDMGAYLGRDFHADRQPSASTVLTGGLGVEESKSELKVPWLSEYFRPLVPPFFLTGAIVDRPRSFPLHLSTAPLHLSLLPPG